MAKSVTLKDQDGNELYPVTSIDLVNGTVPTAKIASSAVTSAKLASSAVTTAKIADSAVTSAKIDWTTFNSAYTSFLWNNDLIDIGTSSTVDVPKLTWTCPEAGGYVVLAEGNIQQVGSTVQYPRIGIYYNGNRVSYSAVALPNSSYQLSWSCIWYGKLAQGGIVKVAATSGYDCRLFEGQHMIVFRIN